MKKNRLFIILIPLIIAISILIGIFVGLKNTIPSKLTGDKKLSEVLNIIEKEYVDTINRHDLIEGLIPKLLQQLDPHSSYISADELEDVNSELEGKFSGIGIQFSILNDTVTVVSVIHGGPSEKVGILPGDRIVSVDDSVFVGKSINENKVLKTLRGKENSLIRLGIKRQSSSKKLSFEVKRGEIPVTSIDASYMIGNNIGYVKVNKFGATTYDEFLTSLAKLKKDGATKYIVDLRGNSGGYLDKAISMVNEFLGSDELIVYTMDKKKRKAESYSDGTGSFQNSPLVVLTDEFSASASEVFSGAIQDNDRGLIIGRRTFGKGLVQNQIDLSDGSAIRLTVARYYTPSGRCIQKEYVKGDELGYESDIINRYERGEFFSQDSIHLDKKQEFKTVGNRTVYGGGGIMPDVFVPRDSSGVTSYYNQVINSHIIYKFALNYTDKYRASLSKSKSVNDLLRKIDEDALLLDFVAYATKNGVKQRNYYINISKKLIINQLQALIARNILGDNEFYMILNSSDATVTEAVKRLNSGQGFPKR